MSILRKSLDSLTIEDLIALTTSEARESAELEFKGQLPFVPQKGQSHTADRWIEKGDRVGEYARDEILAELVAFANSEGGTIVIGLHETKDEPRRATRLEPLPNCDGLARRLLDACEDIVEPRFPVIQARALPADSAGNGYIIMRVGKSSIGPHRLKSTREFYIRRGERSVRMDVREIKDTTLELARTGDRIELAFQERRSLAQTTHERLLVEPDKGGTGPLIVRISSFPTVSYNIPNLTARDDLWWTGNEFAMAVGSQDYPCSYPAREFATRPEIRLRSLSSNFHRDEGGAARFLRADGLVEFNLVHPRRDARWSEQTANKIYVGWLTGLLAGNLAQIHQLRTMLAWDSVEYGLEIEILSEAPLYIRWDDRGFADSAQFKDGPPLLLPRYSVPPSSNYDHVVQAVIHDLFNAAGHLFNTTVKLPWHELGVT